MSNQVKIDGVWTRMPVGFPKTEIKGRHVVLTLRFPKFKSTAIYDPVLSQV